MHLYLGNQYFDVVGPHHEQESTVEDDVEAASRSGYHNHVFPLPISFLLSRNLLNAKQLESCPSSMGGGIRTVCGEVRQPSAALLIRRCTRQGCGVKLLHEDLRAARTKVPKAGHHLPGSSTQECGERRQAGIFRVRATLRSRWSNRRGLPGGNATDPDPEMSEARSSGRPARRPP